MKGENELLCKIKDRKGFTIIELLVVIGVIGILVAMAAGAFNSFIGDSKETAIRHDIKAVSDEIERYRIEGSIDGWNKGMVSVDEIEDGLVYDADGLTKAPKLANTSIVPDEVVKDAGSRLKGSFYSGRENDVIYSEKKNDGEIDKEEELTESEIDKLVNNGYIPVANKVELENIRTSNGVESVWGEGTKWEKKHIGTLGSKYVQVQNVDMSGLRAYKPLGSLSSPFTGEYHGANHTISNLAIAKGLDGSIFGYVDGDVKITNLNVENYTSDGSVIATNVSTDAVVGMSNINIHKVEVNSDSYAGTLFSKVDKPINMSANNISISGSVQGLSNTGGLIGRVDQADSKIAFDNIEASIEVIGESNSGGLIGEFESNGGEIDLSNSTLMVGVYGDSDVGGLIGYVDEYDSKISIDDLVIIGDVSSKKCSNYYGCAAGGLIGEFSWDGGRSLSVNNLDMYLDISGGYTGGIVGEIDGDYDVIKVYNSTINGDITGTSDTGGFVGNFDGYEAKVDIDGFTTNGSINGSSRTGGFIGEINDAYSTFNVDNLTINGDVSGVKTSGFVGRLNDDDNIFVVNNLTINGSIFGSSDTGGFVGDFDENDNKITVNDFTINGDISGGSTGGFIGNLDQNNNEITINRFTINGDITGSDTGGLIGDLDNHKNIITVNDFEIHGNITGSDDTGGLIGELDWGRYNVINVDNFNMYGDIFGGRDTGGLIGQIDRENYITVTNSVIHGEISGHDDTGGAIGELSDSYIDINIENFVVKKPVTGGGYTGGLFGHVSANTINLTDIKIEDNIVGGSSTGGIIGYLSGGDLTITNAKVKGDVEGPNAGEVFGENQGNITKTGMKFSGKLKPTN